MLGVIGMTFYTEKKGKYFKAKGKYFDAFLWRTYVDETSPRQTMFIEIEQVFNQSHMRVK
jgi:hypothetical protein